LVIDWAIQDRFSLRHNCDPYESDRVARRRARLCKRAGSDLTRDTEVSMARAAKPVPEGYQTMTPQLTLDNAAQTMDWYVKALGAKEVSRFPGPDGKIMHAELAIGTSRFIVNDVMQGQKGPQALGGSPATWWLYVDNCDALFERAVKAGATVQVPMQDQFWGDRAGAIADPAGYTWWIGTHKEDLTPHEMQQRAAEHFGQAQSASR
jgi:PhnB protein